jgi:hypothetical protein
MFVHPEVLQAVAKRLFSADLFFIAIFAPAETVCNIVESDLLWPPGV